MATSPKKKLHFLNRFVKCLLTDTSITGCHATLYGNMRFHMLF